MCVCTLAYSGWVLPLYTAAITRIKCSTLAPHFTKVEYRSRLENSELRSLKLLRAQLAA